MDDLTQEQIDRHFERLAAALAKRGTLPVSGGGTRPVTAETAGEFMLMNVETGVAFFKHRDTRNYLLVLGDGTLSIPQRPDDPWCRGFYDAFEMPEGVPA